MRRYMLNVICWQEWDWKEKGTFSGCAFPLFQCGHALILSLQIPNFGHACHSYTNTISTLFLFFSTSVF